MSEISLSKTMNIISTDEHHKHGLVFVPYYYQNSHYSKGIKFQAISRFFKAEITIFLVKWWHVML